MKVSRSALAFSLLAFANPGEAGKNKYPQLDSILDQIVQEVEGAGEGNLKHMVALSA